MRPFIHCLYFICERKVYARTHVNITWQWILDISSIYKVQHEDFPAIIFSHPTWGYFLFNQCLHVMHNYTKFKGLHSRKITSLPNLHASFQSSPKKTAFSSRDSFPYNESRHDSYPQFPRSSLGTRGLQTRSHRQKKRNDCIFRVSLC